jgi:hypothetical protein
LAAVLGRRTTGLAVTVLATLAAAAPAQAAFKRAPIELGPSDGGAPTVAMAPDGTAHVAWAVAEDLMRYCAIPPGVRSCRAPVALSLDARASRPFLLRRPQDGLLAIVVGRDEIRDDPDESAWAFTSPDGVTWSGPTRIAIGIGDEIDDALLTADGQAVDLISDGTSTNDFTRAPLGGPPPPTLVDLQAGSPASFAGDGDLVRLRDGRTLALLGSSSDGSFYRLLAGADPFADASWTPHRRLTPEDEEAVGAAGPRGAFAMYGRHLLDQIRGAPPQVVRRFRGTRWGRPRGVFYEVDANFPEHALEQDARGRLHAVIVGNADSGKRACIAYARTRTGRWFSRAVSVHLALSRADHPRALALAVDARGGGAVTWATAGGAARLQRLKAGRGVTRPSRQSYFRRGCPGFPR